MLRANNRNISSKSFESRQSYLLEKFKEKAYIKDPESKGAAQQMMSDPKAMDNMMSGMKSQIMMFVPNTIIMGWINAFFAGFVVMKLPFPLTTSFKAMMQSGVSTNDLDVRWVSSISWYFLNLIGLSPLYSLILGGQNLAGGVQTPGAAGAPQAGVSPLAQPGADAQRIFNSEAENLALVKHDYILDGIEKRVIKSNQ
jgi:hypothetical protein